MVAAFKRIVVEAELGIATGNGVLVSWSLRPEFKEPGPYTYRLYRGRAISDVPELIAEVVDQPYLYDRRPRFANFDISTYYTVELVTAEGAIFRSDPSSYEASWNHHDWVSAREIVRQETLLLRKKGGTKGWLLKRRHWGPPCPKCTDPNDTSTLDPNCDLCYGTGILGGYFPATEYWVLMNPTDRRVKLTPGQGVTIENIETVRGLAYPAPAEDDIWVQHNSNDRYRIQPGVKTLVRIRGVPIVLDVVIKQLGHTDAIYDVPLLLPG